MSRIEKQPEKKLPETKEADPVPILEHICKVKGKKELGLFGKKIDEFTAVCIQCGKIVPIDTANLKKMTNKT
jgi:hypothetical protein